MSGRLGSIAPDHRGVSAVEFAILAPVLMAFIIGIAQLGVIFFANAGLKSAVGEGVRYATIYPRPTTEQIKIRIADRRFGLQPENLSAPTVTQGKANGRDYLDVEVRYQVPMDFMFFLTQPVTLIERRRVFVHPVNASGT